MTNLTNNKKDDAPYKGISECNVCGSDEICFAIAECANAEVEVWTCSECNHVEIAE